MAKTGSALDCLAVSSTLLVTLNGKSVLEGSLSGLIQTSSSRTQEAKCALHMSDRGHRDAMFGVSDGEPLGEKQLDRVNCPLDRKALDVGDRLVAIAIHLNA